MRIICADDQIWTDPAVMQPLCLYMISHLEFRLLFRSTELARKCLTVACSAMDAVCSYVNFLSFFFHFVIFKLIHTNDHYLYLYLCVMCYSFHGAWAKCLTVATDMVWVAIFLHAWVASFLHS